MSTFSQYICILNQFSDVLSVPLNLLQFLVQLQSLSCKVHCLASPFLFAHLSLWCLGVKEYVLYGKIILPYRKKNVLYGENPKNRQFQSVLWLFQQSDPRMRCTMMWFMFLPSQCISSTALWRATSLTLFSLVTWIHFLIRVPDPILQSPGFSRLGEFFWKEISQ